MFLANRDIHRYKVNAQNFGSLINTGNMLLYTMMSHFAAFGRIGHALMDRFVAFRPIINSWAAVRPISDI